LSVKVKEIEMSRQELAKRFIEITEESKKQDTENEMEYNKSMEATDKCLNSLGNFFTNQMKILQENLQKYIEEVEKSMKNQVESLNVIGENVGKLIKLQKQNEDTQVDPLEETQTSTT
jgi:predicted lipoprotein